MSFCAKVLLVAEYWEQTEHLFLPFEEKGVGVQQMLYGPFLLVTFILSSSLPMLILWRDLMFFFFLGATWRPLLVCCGMIATLQDPIIFTKCRPLLLSGKRRGTEHYFLRNAEDDEFYPFGESPMNGCDIDFQRPANVLTSANNSWKMWRKRKIWVCFAVRFANELLN